MTSGDSAGTVKRARNRVVGPAGHASATGEPWWKSAVVYQIYPRCFCDTERRRRRRPRGHPPPPRPPRLARRRRDLALAVLPVADGRLRLRRRRLLRRRPAVRHARRLRPPARRRARARHPGRSSTGCRTTPATSTRGSSSRARRGSRRKRDWYVWRDGTPDAAAEQLERRAQRRARRGRSTRRPGSSTCTCFLPRAARPRLGEPRGRRRHARHAALLARPRRRRVPHGRRPLHRQGPGAARRPRPSSPASPTSSSTTTRATHDLLRGIRTLLDGYDGDRVMVGEVSCSSTALVAELLRPRRRAAPRRSTSRRCTRRGTRRRGASRSPRSRRRSTRATPGRRWVLSNHDNAAPPHAATAARSAGPGRRRAAADAAGHAVPLRRRGARPRGRACPARRAVSIPADATAAARRSRGTRGPSTAGAARRRGCRGRPTRRTATPRSCGTTDVDPAPLPPPARGAACLARAAARAWSPLVAPAGVLAYRRQCDDDGRVVLVNFERADGRLSASRARGTSRSRATAAARIIAIVGRSDRSRRWCSDERAQGAGTG